MMRLFINIAAAANGRLQGVKIRFSRVQLRQGFGQQTAPGLAAQAEAGQRAAVYVNEKVVVGGLMNTGLKFNILWNREI